MRYINIGCTPCDEDCFPCGHPLARKEAELYLQALREAYPDAIMKVKGFPHDFGTYYEVVALYTEGEPSEEAAYDAEAGLDIWPAKYKELRAKLLETPNAN